MKRIKDFITSRKNRGIFIISFLLTSFSYFLKPLFIVSIGTHFVCSPYGDLGCNHLNLYASRGFPWGFGESLIKFSAFYFILDIVFWFIIVKLILHALALTRDSRR